MWYESLCSPEEGQRRCILPRKRHTPEEVIRKLREADALLGQGQTIAHVCQKFGVSKPTLHRWRNQYGGIKADQVKRLKDLEVENQRLRQAVADLTLDKQMLREVLKKKLLSPAARRRAIHQLMEQFKVSQRRACDLVGQARSTQRRRQEVVDVGRKGDYRKYLQNR